MKQTRNRIVRISFFCALSLLLILTALPFSGLAAEDPLAGTVTGGHAVVLYDKTHDRYLVEQNAADMVNTSTSAKVMTGLLACEQLAGRLEEMVTVTEAMLAESSGYSMKLKVGERLTVRDLLYGAVCGSYNDAAYVLAHLLGGNTSGFVKQMNERALSLGAKATTYTNPLGYPDSAGMITTAYDTLKIARAASENALYMELCSALKHTVPATNKSEARQFYNRNYLVSSATTAVYYNEKCDGMNAGYSGEAGGWSIVTLAHDDGADYICVLLGGKESEDGERIYAYDSVNMLLQKAFSLYDLHTVYPAGAQLGETKIGLTGVGSGDAPYITAEEVQVYAPKGATITAHIELDNDLKAPLEDGAVIGKLTVSVDGTATAHSALLLKGSYEVNALMLVIDTLGDYTTSRAFAATLICFAVLLAAYFLYRKYHRYGIGGRR